MDTVRIEEFFTLAAERHFGRAAKRHHASASTLRRRISELENEIGTDLVDHTRRGVVLTPAGNAFLNDASRILDQLRRTSRLARRVGLDANRYLRIGHIGAGQPLLKHAIRSLHHSHPELELTVSEHTISDGLTLLHDGKLEALLTRPPINDEQIEEAWLIREPLLLALPAEHPAARTPEPIDLDGLSDTPLVLPAATAAPGAHATITDICRAAHLDPEPIAEISDFTSLLILVGAGIGGALIPASVTQHRHDNDIHLRPIATPTATIDLHVAWRRNDTRPALFHLRHALTEAALRNCSSAT